jgi:sec-independent protein translocase protein TatB
MFDVGFAEILLLSLVGLMVLGPERLPKVARTLGGLARRARGSWMNLKRSIEAEMRAEELKTPLKHFEKEIKSTVDRVKSGVDSMKDFDPTTPGSSKPDSTKPGSAEKPGGTDDSS